MLLLCGDNKLLSILKTAKLALTIFSGVRFAQGARFCISRRVKYLRAFEGYTCLNVERDI